MLISAELLNKNTIKLELDKSFYNGVSSYFKLKDNFGLSKNLEIKEVKDNKKSITYILECSEIKLPNEYYVCDEHNLKAPLGYGFYVKSEDFNNEYFYDGDDLGPVYSKEQTTFKVFAPLASEVILKLNANGVSLNLPMLRYIGGIYTLTVNMDLEFATYTYLVKNSGKWTEATDPYAYSATANGVSSVVIDPNKCFIKSNDEYLMPFTQNVDQIIYELHVRDFSVSESSNIKNKGKFVAFMEKGTTYKGVPTGIDYLKSLGVTHIQLLPFYDFGSVDELNQFESYNWGYDPTLYSIPEGSYSLDPNNPYSRILECKNMISSIHKNGLRVNMDVVYNHMFSREHSCFEALVPGYYFRIGKNGKVSNGSFCGNDTDSLMPMMRKFIVDSCLRWVKFYNVDGLRFDLMGIIDCDTLNEIYEKCSILRPGFMMYGEGWSMPTLMDKKLMGTQLNNKKMPKIGFFNDRFREQIKGDTFEPAIGGYTTNGKFDIEIVEDVIIGTSKKVKYGVSYISPNNVVNYVECHDNATLWDKIGFALPEASVEEKIKRQKLNLGIILLSQGVSFIHAGQEFCRTKDGVENSYMSSDEINKLDYELMVQNIDLVNYVRKLIKFRNNNPTLRKTTQKEIKKDIEILHHGNVIFYRFKKEELLIVINPEVTDYNINNPHKVVFDEHGEEANTTTLVPGLSIIIFKESE